MQLRGSGDVYMSKFGGAREAVWVPGLDLSHGLIVWHWLAPSPTIPCCDLEIRWSRDCLFPTGILETT